MHVTYFRRRWHMGRRDAALLLYGGIWLAIGWSLASQPPSPIQRLGLSLLINLAGGYERLGWLWIACGVVALLCAVVAAPGHRTEVEGVGFVALVVPPIVWAASYMVRGLLDWSPSLILPGLVYLAIVAALQLMAGWPEANGGADADRS